MLEVALEKTQFVALGQADVQGREVQRRQILVAPALGDYRAGLSAVQVDHREFEVVGGHRFVGVQQEVADVAVAVIDPGAVHHAGHACHFGNQRDCYICHFLLHTDKPVTAEDFKLSIIDLHRAQTRPAITRRWRNKDLAALYFSALDIGLTRRDKLRFLKGYFLLPLRQILREEASLLAWLEGKANKLYERKQRYGDAL